MQHNSAEKYELLFNQKKLGVRSKRDYICRQVLHAVVDGSFDSFVQRRDG